MDGWFILRGGVRYGPFAHAQLQRMTATGQLLPVDLVAQSEGDPWVPASQVSGLFDVAPLPTPNTTAQAQDAPFDFGEEAEQPADTSSQSNATERPHRGESLSAKGRSSQTALIAVVGVMLLVVLVSGIYFASRDTTKRTTSTGKQDESGRSQPGAARPGSAATNLSYAGGFEDGSILGKQHAKLWANPNVKPLNRQFDQKQFAKIHNENVMKYEDVRGRLGESHDATQRLKGIADGYREELQKVGFPFQR